MKKGLSSSALKLIAICSMMIDHFAVAVYWQLETHTYETYRLMRDIGRLAFPIYCFLLVEGFFHTRDIKGYIKRCFLFAVLSEVPYDMAVHGTFFYPQGQNVYVTLTLGLCTLYGLQRFQGFGEIDRVKRLVCIAAGAGLAQILGADYHYLGVLFIVMFYYLRNMNPWCRDIIGAAAFAYEKTAPLAFLPIHLYNGTRGLPLKTAFYLVYPVHLAIYGIIRMYVIS